MASPSILPDSNDIGRGKMVKPSKQLQDHLRAAVRFVRPESGDIFRMTEAQTIIYPGPPSQTLPEPPPKYLIGEGVAHLEKAALQFAKLADLEDMIAPGYVSRQLGTLLFGIDCGTLRKTDLAQRVQQLIGQVQAEVAERTIYLPVVNLAFEGVSELVVGKVTFRPQSLAFSELEAHSAVVLEDYPIIKAGLQAMRKHPVTAVVQAKVHPSAEHDFALSEVNHALCLLRCYQRLQHRRGFRAFIGVIGDVVPRSSNFMIAFDSASHAAVTARSTFEGAVRQFTVNQDLTNFMEDEAGFKPLHDILRKTHPQRTQLERQILLAISWAGASVSEWVPHVELLHQCIALECLLLDKDDKLQRMFAERLAFLISTSCDHCLAVESSAKTVYRIRNDIVHGGAIDVSQSDVDTAAGLAMSAIITMARKASVWPDVEAFTDWCNALKFRAVGAHAATP